MLKEELLCTPGEKIKMTPLLYSVQWTWNYDQLWFCLGWAFFFVAAMEDRNNGQLLGQIVSLKK